MHSDLSTKQVLANRRALPFKIKGQWTVNFDEYLDVAGLENIHHDLIKSVVKAEKYWEPVIIGSKYALYNQTVPEVTVYQQGAMKESGMIDQLKNEGLNDREIYEYTKFAYPTIGLGKKLLLRTYKNYVGMFAAKHIAAMNHDTEAYELFPELRKWIEDSGAFSEIGRVMLFITERRTCTEVHCDYADLQSRKDQFLLIIPKKIKKMFVLDENFEKQYTNGVINTFDNGTWHGSDIVDTSTFSIRVDGKFSPEFLQKTGLEEHYATRRTE
jgi:hypothetical protein